MNKELKYQLDEIFNDYTDKWKSFRNKNIQSLIVQNNNKTIFNELKEHLRIDLVKKGFEFNELSEKDMLDKESYIYSLLSEFISLHNQLE